MELKTTTTEKITEKSGTRRSYSITTRQFNIPKHTLHEAQVQGRHLQLLLTTTATIPVETHMTNINS